MLRASRGVFRAAGLLLWGMSLLGCAAVELPPAALAAGPGAGPDPRDREAILAMAGEYRVTFAFDETVALAPGYALKPPKRDEATEWVQVLEDGPQRIVLQHVLVLGPAHTVVKHWRQDWEWEPARLWQYEGGRQWRRRALGESERRGRWLQSVWEVDDSPRYFGLGRWQHGDGVAEWTAAPAPRPLPRREYTTRDDYDLILAVNRHALTPGGWVHEQDNGKLRRRDGVSQLLAREVGVNTYTRLQPGVYDFAAGRDYWARTAAFWSQVRAYWAGRMAAQDRIELHERVDGKALYETLFALAAGQPEISAEALARTLDRFDAGQTAAAAR